MASNCGRFFSLPSSLRCAIVSQTTATNLARNTPLPLKAYHLTSPRAYNTSSRNSAYHEAPQSSVNAAEVSHFSALASDWWDPHGSSRLLHLMNPLRHQFIQRCTHRSPTDTTGELFKYLDVGCGGGIFAESAARLPHTKSVTAIDPTPECIAVAQKHARSDPTLLEPGRLNYLNTAIENLPADSAYDVITIFEVIEHIQHPAPFLTNALKHLKPGGWLIGSTIARTLTSWFTTKFVAEDVLRMVPRGTHDWDQYIQPEELKAWARKQEQLDMPVGDLPNVGGGWQCQGVIYVPGLGWKEVEGSEAYGNYFFGVRKRALAE